jgi:hypothetical protein
MFKALHEDKLDWVWRGALAGGRSRQATQGANFKIADSLSLP